MPWHVSPEDIYEVPVRDPETGETATVTCRRFNAQDKAALDDSFRMEFDDEEEVRAEIKIGTWRMLTVQRAVVAWTIPGPPPTPATIATLSPAVYEQIYRAIDDRDDVTPSEGDGPPTPPTPAELQVEAEPETPRQPEPPALDEAL